MFLPWSMKRRIIRVRWDQTKWRDSRKSVSDKPAGVQAGHGGRVGDHQPSRILADKSTGNPDKAYGETVRILLKELRAAGHTLIVVS
jgi:ABC-type ATPase involved in cell division